MTGRQVLAGIRAVLFDLDGTLLDRHRFELFVRGQWTRFASDLQPAGQDEYVRTLIARDRQGYGPRGQLFSGAVAQFGLPPTLAETLRNDFRAGFASACVLFPDAVQTLETLRTSGFKLGLIPSLRRRLRPTASSTPLAICLRGSEFPAGAAGASQRGVE